MPTSSQRSTAFQYRLEKESGVRFFYVAVQEERAGSMHSVLTCIRRIGCYGQRQAGCDGGLARTAFATCDSNDRDRSLGTGRVLLLPRHLRATLGAADVVARLSCLMC
jgi:hypothetical protein